MDQESYTLIIFGFNNCICFLEHHRNQLHCWWFSTVLQGEYYNSITAEVLAAPTLAWRQRHSTGDSMVSDGGNGKVLRELVPNVNANMPWWGGGKPD